MEVLGRAEQSIYNFSEARDNKLTITRFRWENLNLSTRYSFYNSSSSSSIQFQAITDQS